MKNLNCYYVAYRLKSDPPGNVFRALNMAGPDESEVRLKLMDTHGLELEQIREITKQGSWDYFIKSLTSSFQGD